MALTKILKKIGKTATHDRAGYWQYQQKIGKYFFNNILRPFPHGKSILDIGCGEGGVLSVFWENGYSCAGLEINTERIEFARQQYQDKIQFFSDDIRQFRCSQRFDVILMLDVIEHIDEKQRALKQIRTCLSENGLLIISFPPYGSAFGGHQQTLRSFLKYIPYWHLLPRAAYIQLFKWFERDLLESRLEIYDCGISIKAFEKLARSSGFKTLKRNDYLIRPRQSFRFNIPIRENHFPLFKEYMTTGVTYVLSPDNQPNNKPEPRD